MAYIVEGSVVTSIEVTQITTKEVFLGKHIVGDYLFITACQDNGGAVIVAPAGWTEIPAGQAKVNTSRAACFYKKATSSSEANPILTGQNETWVVSSYTVRDADPTTFINADARTSQSATATPTCPSVTTTNNDCLVLRYIGMRRTTKFAPQDSGEIEFLFKDTVTVGGGNTAAGGYTTQPVAGATGTVIFDRESAGDGGSAFTIAINNKAGGDVARVVSQTFIKIFSFGLIQTPVFTDLFLDVASINGIATGAITPTLANNAAQTTEGWLAASSVTFNDALADLFCGQITPIGTHDYTGKNASIVYQVSDASSNRWAAEGILMLLMDTSGNWAAWQARSFADLKNNRTYVFNWTPDTTTPYGQSGVAPDYTLIDRFALVVHRPNSTSNASVTIKDLLMKDTVILVGGSAANPVSPAMLEQSLVGWGYANQASNQGSGQGVAYSGLQIGNGVDTTHADFTATSFEVEERSTSNAMADYTEPFTIYSSANDVLNFTSCVLKTNIPNNLSFNVASSTTSTDSWKGASVIGWDITGLAGKEFDNANITDCSVTQNNGIFSSSFTNSPIQADDLALLSNSTFDANSGIDATVAGIYAVSGAVINSISNSSGGNITINASNGTSVANNLGPNITVNNTNDLTINVTDETTGLPNTQARVHVVAAAEGSLAVGTVIIDKALVDGAGQVTGSVNASNQPYTGLVADAASPGLFVPKPISGSIPSGGVTINVSLVADN